MIVCLIFGCRRPASKDQESKIILHPAAFNAAKALAETEALSAITPRPSGSPGAQKAAEHLLARLRAAGIEAALDEFEEDTPAGKIIFRNVLGVLPGRDKARHPAQEWLIIGAHYDTKAGIAGNFQGANDSGSGAGVVLELARVLKAAPRPANIILAFFDGEECQQHYAGNDGLHGSRRLAEQLTRAGRAKAVRAVIILDMVGDRDLTITIPRNSAAALIVALFQAAEAEGTRGYFSLAAREMLDDHQPFMAAGMPAIDIIDYEYGSAPGQNDYWHTPADTMDKLSAQSLAIIGRTVLRLLNGINSGSPPAARF